MQIKINYKVNKHKVNKMITKEKYFETVDALKEQIVNNSINIKAYKPALKDYQRTVTVCAEQRWDYWNSSNYKKPSEFTKELNTPLNNTETTVLHILYNRIRKRPAHLGSVANDELYLKIYHGDGYRGEFYYNKFIKSLLDNHNIHCYPREGYIEMSESNNG